MSHFTVGLHLCGKNQYATMPGSAVVPLHGIQWHRKGWYQWKLLALTVDILALLFGIVMISECARERLDSKNARLYSTDTIQA